MPPPTAESHPSVSQGMTGCTTTRGAYYVTKARGRMTHHAQRMFAALTEAAGPPMRSATSSTVHRQPIALRRTA